MSRDYRIRTGIGEAFFHPVFLLCRKTAGGGDNGRTLAGGFLLQLSNSPTRQENATTIDAMRITLAWNPRTLPRTFKKMLPR